MSQKYIDEADEIVLNIDGVAQKLLNGIKRNRTMMVILILIGCIFGLIAGKVLDHPKYEASVTYLVSIKGNGSEDSYAATMLGSQMKKTYQTSGLSDLINTEIKKTCEDASWMKIDYIDNEFDYSTNMLTIRIATPSLEHTKVLAEAVEHVMPIYAANQMGYVILNVIDRYVACDKPVNDFTSVLWLVIGIFAGAVCAIIFIVFRIYSMDAVYSKNDMKAIISLPCIGELESIKKKKSKHKEGAPVSLLSNKKTFRSYAENIRKIRQRVDDEMSGNDEKVLMVTSSLSQEGKTTISCNLAIALADAGKKVVLIDTDFYHAGVKDQLMVKSAVGSLQSYLLGESDLSDIISKDFPMDVILGDETKHLDASYLDSEKMSLLIKKLRADYDYIIVDTAPAVFRSDADLFSKYADAAVYVVRYAFASKDDITKGIKSVSGGHIHNLGYILNFAEKTDNKYSDYYC